MSVKNSITIVGSGLVGMSLALSLKNSGISIYILENHLPDIISNTSTDSRPISLSYGSVRILKALGVWDELRHDASAIMTVHVSEQGRFGSMRFRAVEQNVEALGYVAPFARLQSALYQAAAALPNVTIHSIQLIEKIERDDQGARVTVNTASGQQIIQSDLLIAADGTHSLCRDLLGIASREKNNGDVAHIYQLQLAKDHDHTAYERFTSYGILAVLPLREKNRAQLVWTVTKRIAQKTQTWNDDDRLRFLQDTFEGRLAIAQATQSAQFPLKTMIAEKQTATAAVLLGNAAHTIYPVAAQGFNLGLHDVAALSDILCDAHNGKKKLGDTSVLKKYEDTVRAHQKAIFCITDQLTSLFELPLIGGLRGLGLLTTDLVSPVKHKLAKRVMGIAEKLPALLRRGRRE